MPSYQTTGIVIGRTNFGEADRIVRLITPEHGKVSAVAKGVRRIKSRLAGHLELFAETQLTLATGRNLDVITSARLLWYPHQLTASYHRLQLAQMCTVLTDLVATERQPQPELYAHLSEAVRAIDMGAQGPLIELWCKLRVPTLAGYRPELSQCVVCGTHDAGESYSFSSGHGGIVCATDAGPADLPLSQPAIKLWRLLCDYPYATVAHIADGPALAAGSLPACDQFCEHHLGRSFRL